VILNKAFAKITSGRESYILLLGPIKNQIANVLFIDVAN